MAASMQLELRAMSYPEILSMSQSTYMDLVGTDTWQNAAKNNAERIRFEALMQAFADSTKAICKTTAGAGNAVIKAIAGR